MLLLLMNLDMFMPHNKKGGKSDGKRRTIIKPTGLVDRPRKAVEAVERRVEETHAIAQEVVAKVAREFAAPVERMSIAEIDAEIGVLLHKKIRTEEDDLLLLMLVAAAG